MPLAYGRRLRLRRDGGQNAQREEREAKSGAAIFED